MLLSGPSAIYAGSPLAYAIPPGRTACPFYTENSTSYIYPSTYQTVKCRQLTPFPER